MLSIRSSLAAGVVASLVAAGVGTAAVTTVAAAPLPTLVSPALELSAVVSALPAAALPTPPGPIVIPTGTSAGDWIINGYNAVQPWVEYGVSLVAWATSWLPWPIGLIGPQANILYSGWQPIGESLAYSAAYLLDRQFELIVPTLVNGLQTGVTNLVRNEIQWVLSFFPPLPPISLAASAATLPRSAATVRTMTAEPVVETPASGETPAVETAPTPRAARTATRGMARASRSVPAASASTPVLNAPKAPRAAKSSKAGKSRPAPASSTRTARTAR